MKCLPHESLKNQFNPQQPCNMGVQFGSAGFDLSALERGSGDPGNLPPRHPQHTWQILGPSERSCLNKQGGWDWRHGSAVNSTCCSYRSPGFGLHTAQGDLITTIQNSSSRRIKTNLYKTSRHCLKNGTLGCPLSSILHYVIHT